MTIPKSKECVIQAVAILPIDPSHNSKKSHISFECELLDTSDTKGISGLTSPLVLDAAQKRELESKLNKGEIISNKTTMRLDGGGITLSNGKINVPPGRAITLGKGNTNTTNRHLATVKGDKPILVVKVTDADGKVVPYTNAQVSDDVFGTNGDPVNLKSQMYGCSFGQLNIIPGKTFGKGDDIAAPGVIEVTIPITLEGNDRIKIKNVVTAAVQTKLGFNLPGPYQHVMYSLEGCYKGCGWAGFAYANHWLSVYQGKYISYASIQMHGKLVHPIKYIIFVHIQYI